ncbi:MAG: hypothetical protein K9K30_00110 [Burkholderiaceae bacterium]|nr:hypothetical protein [Sulfuritalea sp.]MCF8173633.1 hypothetical protein [Burkholderiaceae bacterium]MCF8184154.1 hypothetical protein [Polynucleobacter sp.]
MVISPQAAEVFIHGYSSLLAEVHRLSNGEAGLEILKMLAAARDITIATPSIIGTAAARLERKGRPVPPEVVCAIKSLQLKQWVYLRDTKTYSVFLEPTGNSAYAVLGLTNRLRDLLGGSGVSLRTGLVKYSGRFVCDGIASNPVWLGPNYRKDFSTNLAALKKEGNFHVSPSRQPITPPGAAR